ncbi:hypothetical protein GCM10010220_23070 [Streptomyces parvulus]|nr:hypothetical protein GCM10010220_23070 [Streptomyces parvulus]
MGAHDMELQATHEAVRAGGDDAVDREAPRERAEDLPAAPNSRSLKRRSAYGKGPYPLCSRLVATS